MASRFSYEVQRYVDMWALPGVHPTNVELLQQLKTADTHHFTKNMDVVGTVSQRDNETRRWNKTHMLGVRTDVWSPEKDELARSLKIIKSKRKTELKQQIKRGGRLDAKQASQLDESLEKDAIMKLGEGDIQNRRLVLKLFKTTATRVRWCGTLEEITTTEVHNSIGSKRRLLTTAVMLPRTAFITQIQENHRTFRVPSIFTFCFVNDDRMWHLSLKQRWFSMGVDFDVEANSKRIGKLDGKLVSFGADSILRLKEHALTDNTQFVDLLTLFTSLSRLSPGDAP